MKCPCENCICLVICKHKYYLPLFNSCTLLEKYLPYFTDASSRSQTKLLKIYNVIKPTKWKLIYNSNYVSKDVLWIVHNKKEDYYEMSM